MSFHNGPVTLRYWKNRGRGEQVRLWLEETGVKYKNEFITGAELKAEREKGEGGPFGSVPILVDGKTELSQATAILSYISHKAKRTPTDPAEAARLLMLSLGAEDLRIKYFGYFSSNPEKKKEHETDLCRRWFGNYEKNLKKVQDGKAFFGGDLISYADCAIWEVIDAHVQWIKPTEKILKEFPLLSAWFDRFKKSPRIAPYLASDRHFKG